MAQEVFWRSKSLDEMNEQEWESLCDGCALCCLHKIEDEDTQEVFYTTVVCHLLDKDNCRCTQYAKRSELVPSCVKLRRQDVDEFHWLPASCSYRLLNEGKDLPDWHPLVTGDNRSVIDAQVSVLNFYEVTDKEVTEDEIVDYIIVND